MQTETVRRATVTSHSRQVQLKEIMKDAVENVLERQDTRRGPYVIQDQDLKLIKNAATSR